MIQSPHQPHRGPRLVDRADFVVHQPEWKRDVAHLVIGEVR